MAPVDGSYTIFFQSAIVSIALPCTIFEIFDAEEYRDLEIQGYLPFEFMHDLEIVDIYRHGLIFLPPIVWVYLHLLLHSEIQTKQNIAKGGSLRQFEIIRKSSKLVVGTNRKPVCDFILSSIVIYAYLLSFPRYNDLLVENLICIFRHFYQCRL